MALGDFEIEAMETAPQTSTKLAERSTVNLSQTAPQAPRMPDLNFGTFTKLLSDRGLTKKAYLNAIAATLDYMARLVTGFLINPLLVAGLGNYLYGAWQILGRLIGYISAASGRPTQALKWTIAYRQASADYEEKRRNVGSAVAVWLLFLPLLAAIGGLLVWLAPSWLKAPVEFSSNVRLAVVLLVVNLMIINLADVPESVLRGENLGYKRMGLSTFLVFIGGGFTAGAMYFNTGIVGVAVANLAATLLSGAFFLQVVRVYIPWFGIAKPVFDEVRQFLGLSWWFLVWRLVMQLIMASDVIVLGRLISVELVTTYTLTKYTPEALVSLVAIVVNGVTPGLGGIIGSGNLQKAARVRGEMMSVTWLVATVVGAAVLLWNRSFVQLWVGAEYYAGSIPTAFIMLMVMQFVLIRNDANIIDLTLNLRTKVLIGAISALLSLILAGVLVGYFKTGITGLCVGFIVGRSVLSVGYPWLIGRFLEVPLFSQLKSVLRPACTTVLFFMLLSNLSDLLIARTWLQLVCFVGMTVGVVSCFAFYVGLSGDQRQHLLKRVRLVTRPQ